MAENKGSTAWLWWTLGVFAFLGLGTGTYFYLKNKGLIGNKSKGDGGGDSNSNDTPTSDVSLNTGTTTYTSSSSSNESLGNTPFKSNDEGNLFRNWVNSKYPQYAKEIDLSLKGDYNNSYIKKAWAKYGAEYEQEAANIKNATYGSGSSSSGGQNNNNEGWELIKGGATGLKYNSSNSEEYEYYILDLKGLNDFVFVIKKEGLCYFAKENYGKNENLNWGRWRYVKSDQKSYWTIEMGNGKGSGTAENLNWLIKAVFKANYPNEVEEARKTNDWSDFDGTLRGEQGKYVDPMDSMM